MEYKSYFTEFEVAMKLEMEGFCEGVKNLVVGNEKAICPVGVNEGEHKAGTLKKTITGDTEPSTGTVMCGIPEGTEAALYAGLVEKGIGQAKQPYLEQGAVNSIASIIDVARKHYSHLSDS